MTAQGATIDPLAPSAADAARVSAFADRRWAHWYPRLVMASRDLRASRALLDSRIQILVSLGVPLRRVRNYSLDSLLLADDAWCERVTQYLRMRKDRV